MTGSSLCGQMRPVGIFGPKTSSDSLSLRTSELSHRSATFVAGTGKWFCCGHHHHTGVVSRPPNTVRLNAKTASHEKLLQFPPLVEKTKPSHPADGSMPSAIPSTIPTDGPSPQQHARSIGRIAISVRCVVALFIVASCGMLVRDHQAPQAATTRTILLPRGDDADVHVDTPPRLDVGAATSAGPSVPNDSVVDEPRRATKASVTASARRVLPRATDDAPPSSINESLPQSTVRPVDPIRKSMPSSSAPPSSLKQVLANFRARAGRMLLLGAGDLASIYVELCRASNRAAGGSSSRVSFSSLADGDEFAVDGCPGDLDHLNGERTADGSIHFAYWAGRSSRSLSAASNAGGGAEDKMGSAYLDSLSCETLSSFTTFVISRGVLDMMVYDTDPLVMSDDMTEMAKRVVEGIARCRSTSVQSTTTTTAATGAIAASSASATAAASAASSSASKRLTLMVSLPGFVHQTAFQRTCRTPRRQRLYRAAAINAIRRLRSWFQPSAGRDDVPPSPPANAAAVATATTGVEVTVVSFDYFTSSRDDMVSTYVGFDYALPRDDSSASWQSQGSRAWRRIAKDLLAAAGDDSRDAEPRSTASIEGASRGAGDGAISATGSASSPSSSAPPSGLRDCDCLKYDPIWCEAERTRRATTLTTFYNTGNAAPFRVFRSTVFFPPDSGRPFAARPENVRIPYQGVVTGPEASCGRIPTSFSWGHVSTHEGRDAVRALAPWRTLPPATRARLPPSRGQGMKQRQRRSTWITFPLTDRWPLKRHMLQHPCTPAAAATAQQRPPVAPIVRQCITTWGSHGIEASASARSFDLSNVARRTRTQTDATVTPIDPIWEVDIEECVASGVAPSLMSGSSHQEGLLKWALIPYLMGLPADRPPLPPYQTHHPGQPGFVGFEFREFHWIDSPPDGPRGRRPVFHFSWNPYLDTSIVQSTIRDDRISMNLKYHIFGRGAHAMTLYDVPLSPIFQTVSATAAATSSTSPPLISIVFLLQMFHGRPMKTSGVSDPCGEWNRQDMYRELAYCGLRQVEVSAEGSIPTSLRPTTTPEARRLDRPTPRPLPPRPPRPSPRDPPPPTTPFLYYDPGPMTNDSYSATWTDWDGSHYLGPVPRMMATQLFHFMCHHGGATAAAAEGEEQQRRQGAEKDEVVEPPVVVAPSAGPPEPSRGMSSAATATRDVGAEERQSKIARRYRGNVDEGDDEDEDENDSRPSGGTAGATQSDSRAARGLLVATPSHLFERDPRRRNDSILWLCGCRSRCGMQEASPLDASIDWWKQLANEARRSRHETKAVRPPVPSIGTLMGNAEPPPRPTQSTP